MCKVLGQASENQPGLSCPQGPTEFIFSTRPKLTEKIHKPQFISEETETQKRKLCSKSQDQGWSPQTSGLQAQCASCDDALAPFVLSLWMKHRERYKVTSG